MKIPRRLPSAVCACALVAAAAGSETLTWREVESSHFTVVTDASAKSARELASRLERFRHALSRVLPDRARPYQPKTLVYAFRDHDTFRDDAPAASAHGREPQGYFHSGAHRSVIALDLSASVDAYERVSFHEYAHLALSREGVALPLWFQEGAAEFYANTRLSDGGATIGFPDERHRRTLARNFRLPLATLLAADSDWLARASAEDAALFYAQAWLLVHYWIAGDGAVKLDALTRYLEAVRGGDDPVDAVVASLRLELETLSDALDAYGMRHELPRTHLSIAERRFEGLATRTLVESERVRRRGELFLFTDRTGRARDDLRRAVYLDPSSGPAWEALGLTAAVDGHSQRAKLHLRHAVSLGTISPGGLYEFARLLLTDSAGGWIAEIPDDVAREAESALRRSLELAPAQSETARLLAFVYLARGVRLDDAMELVEAALALSPNEPSVLVLHGQILAQSGDYTRARATFERVRGSATGSAAVAAASELLERLDRLERAR